LGKAPQIHMQGEGVEEMGPKTFWDIIGLHVMRLNTATHLKPWFHV